MKTKHYRKEFNLSDKAEWKRVMTQFKEDFLSDLVMHASFKNWNWDTFTRLVDSCREKFDNIWLKEPMTPPEYLWKKFYKEDVVPAREDMFPDEVRRRREERQKKEIHEAAKREEREKFERMWQKRQELHRKSLDWQNRLCDAFGIDNNSVNPFARFELSIAVSMYLRNASPPIGATLALGLFGKELTDDSLRKAFKKRVFEDKNHPDLGGSAEMYRKLTDARDAMRVYLSRKNRNQEIDALLKEGKENGYI